MNMRDSILSKSSFLQTGKDYNNSYNPVRNLSTWTSETIGKNALRTGLKELE